jgi:transcription elongation factor Elf1
MYLEICAAGGIMEVVFAEPKPCPFCGTNVIVNTHEFIINCPQCGAVQRHETGSYWNCMVNVWNESVNAYKELNVGSGYQLTANGVKPILPKNIYLSTPVNANGKFEEIYKRAKAKEKPVRRGRDYEYDVARYEAELYAAMDKWFTAREGLERSRWNEKIFEGGFRLAWEISRK